MSATVIAVDEAADGSGDLVVSLLMSRSDAVALGATATGSVSLVLVGPARLNGGELMSMFVFASAKGAPGVTTPGRRCRGAVAAPVAR